MRDVERVARERAERPRVRIWGNFESDRQKKKMALVKQRDYLNKNKTRKLSEPADTQEEQKIQKVAEYCWLPTDEMNQELSIRLLISEHKQRILSNPSWKYVGTYVDDGCPGKNAEHRQGFQKLMNDALDGKIDKIITKSVSRFASNLMDCIGWVETLQNHDPPVSVFFEQENLDTRLQTDRFILFVLAMAAQEENRYDHI